MFVEPAIWVQLKRRHDIPPTERSGLKEPAASSMPADLLLLITGYNGLNDLIHEVDRRPLWRGVLSTCQVFRLPGLDKGEYTADEALAVVKFHLM